MPQAPFPVARFLRIAVAVVLTAIVVYQAHPAEVAGAAAGADLRWFGAAVALVLIDRTLMALRWLDLLGALTPGSRPRFGVVLEIFFVSSFVSNFVPSIAADLYRAYALAGHRVELAESTASVLVDRLLGVLSMAIVGACALPFAHGLAVEGSLSGGLAAAFAVCAAGGLLLFSGCVASAVLRVANVIPIDAVRRSIGALVQAVRRYSHHHVELARVLMMSIVVQGIRVLQAWCLGQGLGIEVPLLTYCALVPPILLIMQLPVTVNGLGTTQLAFAALFAPLGVPPARTFAVSVLFLLLGVVGSLPGGFLYALGRAPELRKT